MAKGDRLQINSRKLEAKLDAFLKEPDTEPPQTDNATKKPYKRPSNHYKTITIPFDEPTYNALLVASKKADRKPTDFIKRAINKAIKTGLKWYVPNGFEFDI